MGLLDFFKKRRTPLGNQLDDLTLPNMKAGYYVDYDMKTWQISARHHYDWGDGDITDEWQLKSHDQTIYLECESDDEEIWSISTKIQISQLEGGIVDHILKHGDPPEEIFFEGSAFFLEESAGGLFFKNGTPPGRELIKWDYSNKAGNRFVSIEQWGENEFEASTGQPAEPYQFTNILPSLQS
mgnify:CR=1 FL=1